MDWFGPICRLLTKRAWAIAGLTGTKIETTAYYPSGEVKWKGWPDGDTTGSDASPWTYDRAGRLNAMPGILWTRYNPGGQVIEIRYANGTQTWNSYDAARDWLTSVTIKIQPAGTVLQQYSYTRDAAGRITAMDATPSAEHWTYSYDEIDRLLTSSNSSDSSSSRSFTYNNAGSILTQSTVGTYVYPAQGPSAVRPHAPSSVNGSSRTYDANGNLTAGAGATLTYDGDNRLVQVVKSGATVTYAYGPDGGRIKTVSTVGSSPATTSYLLGSSELDNAGVLTKIPNPDIRIVGSTACWVHRDHLASVKLETDASGAVPMSPGSAPSCDLPSAMGMPPARLALSSP